MAEHEDLFGEISSLIQDHDVRILSKDMNEDQIIDHFLQLSSNDSAFYIGCLSNIIQQYQRWKINLPRVEPFYAVKCNPDIVILKVLAKLGCNFDCASKNEIAKVCEVGVDPERIVFANPVKSISGLRYARSQDVDLLTFDSEMELYKIKLYHPKADLILRIKTDESNSLCKFNCKFGSELSEVSHLLDVAKTLRLKVIGVSFHVGSGCRDPGQYYRSIETARSAFDIAKEKGLTFKILDIGGGFPGTITSPEGQISFESIAEQVNLALEQFFSDESIRIIAEPGRYFVASCYTLVTTIIGKKEYQEEDEQTFVYYINEGVYGGFNCIMFDHAQPEILPYNERNEKRYRSRIFGPTCDSLDKISEELMLPDLSVGEVLTCRDLGAYTTASQSNGFNGIEVPEIYYYL